MAVPSKTRPTIAFFGATGGCTAAALAQTLKAGYKAIALARTPTKLTNLLLDSYAVPGSALENLTIIKGSVTDPTSLRAVLLPPSGAVTLIIFGIGAAPVFRYSLVQPFTIDQPTICADGVDAILSVLSDLQKENALREKPAFLCVSTTGLSKKQRDVPWAMYGLYHYLLAVPHQDKRNMEESVRKAAQGADAKLHSAVFVRPTLLMDGPAKGSEGIRVGWEWAEGVEEEEKAPGPQLGYVISRADVGEWIFREVVNGTANWKGKCVTLTG